MVFHFGNGSERFLFLKSEAGWFSRRIRSWWMESDVYALSKVQIDSDGPVFDIWNSSFSESQSIIVVTKNRAGAPWENGICYFDGRIQSVNHLSVPSLEIGGGYGAWLRVSLTFVLRRSVILSWIPDCWQSLLDTPMDQAMLGGMADWYEEQGQSSEPCREALRILSREK